MRQKRGRCSPEQLTQFFPRRLERHVLDQHLGRRFVRRLGPSLGLAAAAPLFVVVGARAPSLRKLDVQLVPVEDLSVQDVERARRRLDVAEADEPVPHAERLAGRLWVGLRLHARKLVPFEVTETRDESFRRRDKVEVLDEQGRALCRRRRFSSSSTIVSSGRFDDGCDARRLVFVVLRSGTRVPDRTGRLLEVQDGPSKLLVQQPAPRVARDVGVVEIDNRDRPRRRHEQPPRSLLARERAHEELERTRARRVRQVLDQDASRRFRSRLAERLNVDSLL